MKNKSDNINETTLAGGPGNIFGVADAGMHGGSIGNDKDAWRNSYTNVPIEYLHGDGKNKKSKKKKSKIPIYRRRFVEMMNEDDDNTLACSFVTEDNACLDVIYSYAKRYGSMLGLKYKLDENNLLLIGELDGINKLITKMEVLLGEKFNNGSIIVIPGDL